MRAGKLRNIIQIQEKQVVRGVYGQEEITYVTIATVRASIKYLSGQDGLTSDQLWGKNIVEFRLRYTDISVIDRILYDSREFDIITPIRVPNDVQREIIITAEERSK